MHYSPVSRAGEVVGVDVGVLDIRVRRSFHGMQSRHSGGGIRGNIATLSDASRRRLIERARNTSGLRTLLTFTFPDAKYSDDLHPFMSDGRYVKGILEKLRKGLIRRGLAGFWFLEFQKRGAPHFHFFCVGVLSDDHLATLRALWHKLAGSTCPHHYKRGMDYTVLTKPEAAAGYAAKYSTKNEQKTVPEHYRGIGRFWGFFGDLPKALPISVDVSDVVQLVRLARAAARAQRRDRGPGYRVPRDKGLTGFASWYVAPAIRYFLERVYTVPESPAGWQIGGRRSHMLGC